MLMRSTASWAAMPGIALEYRGSQPQGPTTPTRNRVPWAGQGRSTSRSRASRRNQRGRRRQEEWEERGEEREKGARGAEGRVDGCAKEEEEEEEEEEEKERQKEQEEEERREWGVRRGEGKEEERGGKGEGIPGEERGGG